jgi:hypothetical protein
MPEYLKINDVTEADYILISHAHFDQYVVFTKVTGNKTTDLFFMEVCLELTGSPSVQALSSSQTAKRSIAFVMLAFQTSNLSLSLEASGSLCSPKPCVLQPKQAK